MGMFVQKGVTHTHTPATGACLHMVWHPPLRQAFLHTVRRNAPIALHCMGWMLCAAHKKVCAHSSVCFDFRLPG